MTPPPPASSTAGIFVKFSYLEFPFSVKVSDIYFLPPYFLNTGIDFQWKEHHKCLDYIQYKIFPKIRGWGNYFLSLLGVRGESMGENHEIFIKWICPSASLSDFQNLSFDN